MTDEFGLRNQNQTSEQGLEVGQGLIQRARQDGKPITVSFIVSFGCPFAGRVPASRVLGFAERLMASGPPDEICVADTIGVGVPSAVRELVGGLRSLGAVAGAHFHNTRNTGYANALAALEAGASALDASVGGTGGCPFAPPAARSLGTEDLVVVLEGGGRGGGGSLKTQ